MGGKFANVPIENETKILFELESKLGKYDVLYQRWYFEGITAESIIFSSDDLGELSDYEIEQLVRKSPLMKPESQFTLKRSGTGFTFANFNFDSEQ